MAGDGVTHERTEDVRHYEENGGICGECSQIWPCEVADLTARLAQAEELLAKDPDVDWPEMAKMLAQAEQERDRLTEAWSERDHERFLQEERAEVAERELARLRAALRAVVNAEDVVGKNTPWAIAERALTTPGESAGDNDVEGEVPGGETVGIGPLRRRASLAGSTPAASPSTTPGESSPPELNDVPEALADKLEGYS